MEIIGNYYVILKFQAAFLEISTIGISKTILKLLELANYEGKGSFLTSHVCQISHL